jgi:soluble lytic murein transglycosylase-like protein
MMRLQCFGKDRLWSGEAVLRMCAARAASMGLAFLFCGLWGASTAHADLWAHVDARGVMHFAAEPLDDRYQLFFKGDTFDSERDMAPASVARTPDVAARVVTFFDISSAYKSVRPHLRAAAGRHGLDYELLQALIATESGFDAQAVSPRGAVGLMQLMPATATRFGVAAEGKRSVEQRLTDPATNVAAGARYLRYLLDLFEGRMDLALAAYNAGEGAVQRAGHQIPAYRETQNYVKNVLGLYEQLKPPAALLAHRAAPRRVRMELPPVASAAAPSPADTGLPARVALGTSTELQVNE